MRVGRWQRCSWKIIIIGIVCIIIIIIVSDIIIIINIIIKIVADVSGGSWIVDRTKVVNAIT